MEKVTREMLEQEVLALEVVFTASGTRREDGRTAAQIEAELNSVRKEET